MPCNGAGSSRSDTSVRSLAGSCREFTWVRLGDVPGGPDSEELPESVSFVGVQRAPPAICVTQASVNACGSRHTASNPNIGP